MIKSNYQFCHLVTFSCKKLINYCQTKQQTISMQSLLQTPSPKPIQLKVTSKQEFFATKRYPKRIKTSQCFSEPAQSHPSYYLPDNPFILSSTKDDPLSCELQSTYGSERVFAFKKRPPRRKYNPQAKPPTLQAHSRECQSESDGETPMPLTSSPRNHPTQLPPYHQPIFKLNSQQHTKHPRKFSRKDFLLLGKMGEGTYSKVFRAIDRRTGFICALKVLEKQKIVQLGIEDNLVNQIKIASFLTHPNIAQIYSFFHDQQYVYLVCQYATDGHLLAIAQPKIKLKKGMLSETVSKIITQLTDAVKYLHNHDIIHRDIKPQNVLLTLYDTVKLCDFGWAIHNPDNRMRATICGTPLYFAPEIVAEIQYDESVDVWAVGVLTYELLTDENPFKIYEMGDIKKILSEDVHLESIRNKTAVDFLGKALQKDRQKRKNIYELSSHPFLGAEVEITIYFLDW